MWIRQSLVALVSDWPNSSDAAVLSVAVAEGFRWRIQVIYRDLLAKGAAGELQDYEEDVKDLMAQAYDQVVKVVERLERELPQDDNSDVAVVRTGFAGRPSFDIPNRLLNYLLDIHLSVPKIARIVGVSISTVRRRMTQYGLSVHDTYSVISEEEL